MENNAYRLNLYIDNSREIYAVTEWLQNALAKKIKRGLKPDLLYLANCSTTKKVLSMAAKMVRDFDGIKVTTAERMEAANRYAEIVTDNAIWIAENK